MTRYALKKTAQVLAGATLLFYVSLLILNSGNRIPMIEQGFDTGRHRVVAIFGATGTIGDGLLKAAINDPDVDTVRVFTRRPSPRIEAGVETGKVQMTVHGDYLDYSAILDDLADVDAVFWAIGLSSQGMDEESYREIHLNLPSAFLRDWLKAGTRAEASFHYVSGSGAKPDSRMMWAREKARAESELARMAENSRVRVVSYRPAVILPTESEAHLGHRIAYGVLRPIKAAVAAESIGRSMLEVSARGPGFPNRTVLENTAIVDLGIAYEERR